MYRINRVSSSEVQLRFQRAACPPIALTPIIWKNPNIALYQGPAAPPGERLLAMKGDLVQVMKPVKTALGNFRGHWGPGNENSIETGRLSAEISSLRRVNSAGVSMNNLASAGIVAGYAGTVRAIVQIGAELNHSFRSSYVCPAAAGATHSWRRRRRAPRARARARARGGSTRAIAAGLLQWLSLRPRVCGGGLQLKKFGYIHDEGRVAAQP
jgi:hypothetical protein